MLVVSLLPISTTHSQTVCFVLLAHEFLISFASLVLFQLTPATVFLSTFKDAHLFIRISPARHNGRTNQFSLTLTSWKISQGLFFSLFLGVGDASCFRFSTIYQSMVSGQAGNKTMTIKRSISTGDVAAETSRLVCFSLLFSFTFLSLSDGFVRSNST
jgi:hypothetical protein